MIARLLLTSASVMACLALAAMLTGQLQVAATTGRYTGGHAPADRLRAEIQQGLKSVPLQYDRQAALSLARMEPLDPLPYSALLTQTVAERDLPGTQDVAEHILRLNPRNQGAWLALLGVAAEENRIDDAIGILSRLYVLDPDRRPQYIAALAEIGQTPSARIIFLKAVAGKPPWGLAVIDALLEAGASDDLVLAMTQSFPQRRQRYLRYLADRNEWASAYEAFLTFLPPEQRQRPAIPFDPTFSGGDAPPPFNWAFNAPYADIEPNTGLTVNFPGQRKTWLTSQVMALPPGQYVMAASMRGQMSLDGGYFAWEVSCLDGASLGRLDIRELMPLDDAYSRLFKVPPSGCDFQKLELLGMGGVYPISAHAIVSDISIVSNT